MTLVQQQRLRKIRRLHRREMLLVHVQDTGIGKGLWTDNIPVLTFLRLISAFLTIAGHYSSASPLCWPGTRPLSRTHEWAHLPRVFLAGHQGPSQVGEIISVALWFLSRPNMKKGAKNFYLSMESYGFELIFAVKHKKTTKKTTLEVNVWINKSFFSLFFLLRMEKK